MRGWTVYHVAREMTTGWTAGREICCMKTDVKCVTLQRRRKRVENPLRLKKEYMWGRGPESTRLTSRIH